MTSYQLSLCKKNLKTAGLTEDDTRPNFQYIAFLIALV